MSTRLQKRFNEALLGGLVASLLFAHGIAGAVSEAEPNDTMAQAQELVITGTGATVSAMIGTAAGGMTTDLDVYAFEGSVDNVPSIMVISDGSWDTLVGLYDSAGNLLDSNDDAWPMNPGSVSGLDSRIDTYKLPANGRYYVAVTSIPRYLGDNCTVVMNVDALAGAYTLVISGVTVPAPAPAPDPTPTPDPTPVPDPTPAPPPTTDAGVVTIKVLHWPGNNPQDAHGNKLRHPIPVAILSSADFDAMSVDPNSLRFGATGDEESLMRCRIRGQRIRADDVKDHMKDLVCYFNPERTRFGVGDVQGRLKGKTMKGDAIEGSASLKIFQISSKKTESWHKRHNVDPRVKPGKKAKSDKQRKK